MYVILVYDVNQKRVGKMLKKCRQYLHWVQNSVFEGEISESSLARLMEELGLIMDDETDNLIIFKSRNKKWLEKEIYGCKKGDTGTIL